MKEPTKTFQEMIINLGGTDKNFGWNDHKSIGGTDKKILKGFIKSTENIEGIDQKPCSN